MIVADHVRGLVFEKFSSLVFEFSSLHVRK